MVKKLIEILKNRAKVGGINFLLELTIGVLSEWQRANKAGNLDAFNTTTEQKNDIFNRFDENQRNINHG